MVVWNGLVIEFVMGLDIVFFIQMTSVMSHHPNFFRHEDAFPTKKKTFFEVLEFFESSWTFDLISFSNTVNDSL